MTLAQYAQDGVDAVRSDGGLVHIRTVTPADQDQLRSLHEHASDRSIFLRFFSLSRASAKGYLDKLLKRSTRMNHALVACIGGEIVGLAAFEELGATSAEVALLVEDTRQHEGIGT